MAADAVCKACRVGRREPHLIRVLLDRGDRLVIVQGVPAEVCNHCDAQVFAPEILDRLQAFAGAALPGVPVLHARTYDFGEG